jgi:hypothetical protein
MSKEHEIKSLDDLCNLVNDDNLEVLSEDLKKWLISYHFTLKEIRKLHPKITRGKKNAEIAMGSFIWIDDNESKIKGVIVEQNGKTERVDFDDNK